jgi:hypothetical protein
LPLLEAIDELSIIQSVSLEVINATSLVSCNTVVVEGSASTTVNLPKVASLQLLDID